MPKPRDRAVYKTGSPLDTNQHAEKESLQKKKKKLRTAEVGMRVSWLVKGG